MQLVRKVLTALVNLWNRGCLGKIAVGFLALVVIGIRGAPFGRQQSQAPAAAPVIAATAVPAPTAEPAPTNTPRPTSTPIPTATAHAPKLPTDTPIPISKPEPTAVPVVEPTPAPQQASFDRNGDGKVTCADFDTRAAAKVALDAGYKKLDGNSDGVPCESLP